MPPSVWLSHRTFQACQAILICFGLGILSGCLPGLSGLPGSSSPEEEIALRTYRDSLLDLDMGYPEGWTFTDKTTFGLAGRTEDLYFEPMNTLWTRRFTVKAIIPDRIPEGRTVREFRREYLDRLEDGGDAVSLEDTAWTTLGGQEAFRARYTYSMGGKAFTRHADYICVKDGRDIALNFEVSAENAGTDLVLYERIAERFRFYRP